MQPHQHLAVIPNDIPWYWLAVAILIGSALVAYGAQVTFERWERDAHLPEWFSVAGGVFGIVLATVMGGIAGHILWHWSLGMMCAICGAWGSQWVLGVVASRIGARQAANKLLNESAPETNKRHKRKDS